MTISTRPEIASGDLFDAIGWHDVKAVKKLLDNGADFNEEDEVGRDALSLAVAFGNVDIVRLILDAGADVNAASRSQITPLMGAACYNSIEITRLLLERGADVNAKSEHNWTAVIYAAMGEEKADILRLLIERGADIGVRDNRSGKNALDIAETWGRTKIIDILKEAPKIWYQVAHARIAAKQEKLKAQAQRSRLRVGPG